MIQYIDRKTVLNLVYTQQATRMADAYETLLADFSQMTAWGRGLESDLSHARVEISFLKAEVERLNVVIGLEQKTIRNLQQTPEWSEITRLTAYCRDLQAEVERLTEDNRQLKKAFEIAEGIIKRMGNAAENAAKEGKPSV